MIQNSNTLVVLLLIACAPIFAQPSKVLEPVFDHPIRGGYGDASFQRMPGTRSSPDSVLRLLAVMVEFQEDADERTTGNGRFDLNEPPEPTIDPPPHNRSYFQHHLTFVENYFRRVSNGRLRVTGTVLDSVVRLSNPMRSYSPPRSNPLSQELGRLVEESWRKVDSLIPGIPFREYDAFIIFHAGVGRDIDLAGIFGFDPTPFDIPSLYVGLASLRRMFSDPAYPGVVVGGGRDTIRNSMIIPETESRRVFGAMLRLGINGLLAASIGSHLGLPDLFDTKTGRSAIGRFGLMDGNSIFSWDGIFPPEPSAWEKYFLGWVEPITVAHGDRIYDLPAVSMAQAVDTIYRVLISEREYFLIENRNRDANRDGARVSVARGNEIHQMIIPRDTNGFRETPLRDKDSLYGVVVDVDEFDWSIPGGVFGRERTFFDGGILIWHVDENVIEAGMRANSVNADPKRRGVDLEEADGSQDIGESYGSFTAGSGSEAGTPLDFWYDGHTAPLRLRNNAFTPTTQPNSLGNNLANSHVYINEFSTRGPRMRLRIRVGDEDVQMLSGFPKSIRPGVGKNSISVGGFSTSSRFLVAATNHMQGPSLFAWNVDGSPLIDSAPDGEIVRWTGEGRTRILSTPVVSDLNADGTVDIATAGDFSSRKNLPFVAAWSAVDADGDSRADELFEVSFALPGVTSPLVLSDSFLAVGRRGGLVTFLSASGQILGNLRLNPNDSTDIVGLSIWNQPSHFLAVSRAGRVAQMSTGSLIRETEIGNEMVASAVVGNLSTDIGKRAILAARNGEVHMLDEFLQKVWANPVRTHGEIHNSPALADLDGDGSKDVVLFSDNKIWAFNAGGSSLDNFPISVSTNKPILTSPIVADIDGNGTQDIVAVTQEGLVVAYDRTGRMVRGFPLQAGSNKGSTPAAFYLQSGCRSCVDIGVAVASDDGHLYAWRTGTIAVGVGEPPAHAWPQHFRDARNSSLDDSQISGTPITREFFPESRAYNWPNPVDREHGYKTRIRYYLGSDARIRIRIFDLAGDQVDEFPGPGIGGLDNEVEWDVSRLQSGIYFAHVEANGSGGSGNAVIKIAVVK